MASAASRALPALLHREMEEGGGRGEEEELRRIITGGRISRFVLKEMILCKYLAALYRTAFDLALSVRCRGESALCVVCSVSCVVCSVSWLQRFRNSRFL